MKISCPHCGQHYELENSFIGKLVTCERCWKDFTALDESQSLAESNAKAPEQEEQKVVPPVYIVPTTQRCEYCNGVIPYKSKKCRHCGEWLDSPKKHKNPVIFVLLGIFFGLLGAHSAYVYDDNAQIGHILATITCIIAFVGEILGNGTFILGSAILLFHCLVISSELTNCEHQVALVPSRLKRQKTDVLTDKNQGETR